MRLDGKRALITGAGSGIGRALAIEGARRGLRLMLVGRRQQALDETAALAGGGSTVHTLAADVTRPADRAMLVASLRESRRGLDILVNNAGKVAVGPLSGLDDAELASMLAVNLAAPISLTRDLLPFLEASGRGRVVNVGSVFGDIAFPYFAAYSASKFGLRGLSDALRRELAGRGIGVTYVAPRGTRTPAADSFDHLVGPMGMALDPPEKVGAMIWDAVERDAREAYPRGPERLFVRLQRMLPRLIDRALIRRARDPKVLAATREAD